MSDYIYLEAQLALHSFLLGLVLMISYDLLRLFRLLSITGNGGRASRTLYTASIVRG